MIYYVILVLIIAVLGIVTYKLWQDKKENENELVLIEKEKDDYITLGSALAEYKQKLADLEELKKSILQKAFAGEL